MALSEGTRLGVYEVSTKIGEGGMGEVTHLRCDSGAGARRPDRSLEVIATAVEGHSLPKLP